MSDIPVGSHLNLGNGARKIKGLRDGLQWWQTFTIHAVGIGQQDMGIWIPYDCYIVKLRYRAASMGTGGSPLVQLQTSPLASTGVISGTSFAPATSPSWNTPTAPGISLSEDDLIWAYMTAANTTTQGAQIKAELLLERR